LAKLLLVSHLLVTADDLLNELVPGLASFFLSGLFPPTGIGFTTALVTRRISCRPTGCQVVTP
jgi:hypothetical protein